LGGLESLIPASGRDLALPELEQFVQELAVRPELWRQQVRHERDQRFYAQLHRDPHLDVWLICWDAEQETGLHDHDRSSGTVRVVEGNLLEDYFTLRGGSIVLETRAHAAGSAFSFDATYIHDVRHDGGTPTTSLHAYSPALWRMGHYALGPHGLGRTSLSYVEEVAA
jgi:predicted metal-dependent enzyme (double-stranded beta helix superfamily)